MSGIEAYRIQSNFLLDLTQSLAAVKEYAAAWRDVLAIHRQVKSSIDGITAQTDRATAAARNYANALRDANGYTNGMAANVAGAAAAMQQAATATRQAATDARNFTMQGAPYVPGGTNLVPVGGAYTRTEATGARPGEANAVVPYRAPGDLNNRGGTNPPGAVPIDAPPAVPTDGGPGPIIPLGGMHTNAILAGIYETYKFWKTALSDAVTVEGIKAALSSGAEGFSTADVNRAYDKAVETQKAVPVSTIAENLAAVVQMKAITQDTGASIDSLPQLARFRAINDQLHRDGNAELTAIINEAELRGAIFKQGPDGREVFDPGAFSRIMLHSEQITGMTGGKYGATNVLQFLRSGGVSAKTLDDDNGFVEYLALIQALGTAKAGTALKSFGSQFVGGRMAIGTAGVLEDWGVINKNPTDQPNLYHEHHGMIEYLHEGAYKSGEKQDAAEHPEQFVLTHILPGVRAYLASTLGEKYTKADELQRQVYEQAELQRGSSRLPTGDFMAQMITVAKLMDRDLSANVAYKKAHPDDTDLYNSVVKNNAEANLKGVTSSLNAFLVQCGENNMGAATATLKGLTAALGGLQSVAQGVHNIMAAPKTADEAWQMPQGKFFTWLGNKLDLHPFGGKPDGTHPSATDIHLNVPIYVNGVHDQTITKVIKDATGPNTGTPGNDTRGIPPAPGEH